MRKRLATLDVFSGCGGLTHGLHEAGVAESRWAIELFAPAANAFKVEVARFPENRNCEPGFCENNRFFYCIRKANEPELRFLRNWN